MLKRRLVAKKSAIHGKGLFAKDAFRRGEKIGTFKGKPTDEDGLHVLWVADEDEDDYQGYVIENILKYANHDKKPNARVEGFDMYALRKIQEGDEITFDYGPDWHA